MIAEKSWSMVDPKPVMTYVSSSDDYIVYWNGVVMPHSMALCLAMEHFGIFATPEMKYCMEQQFRDLYYANAFQRRDWDEKVASGNLYSTVRRLIQDHLNCCMEGKKAKDVLGWFCYSRARDYGKQQSS